VLFLVSTIQRKITPARVVAKRPETTKRTGCGVMFGAELGLLLGDEEPAVPLLVPEPEPEPEPVAVGTEAAVEEPVAGRVARTKERQFGCLTPVLLKSWAFMVDELCEHAPTVTSALARQVDEYTS
jgi:hypothetical protein